MEIIFNFYSFLEKKWVLVGKENFYDRFILYWFVSDISFSVFLLGFLMLNLVFCFIFLFLELKKKVVYNCYLSN